VSDSQHCDDVVINQEDDGVWESPQQGAANVLSAAYLGECRRPLIDAAEARPTSATNSAPNPSPRASYQ
jgi:hypothetical protein